MRRRSFFARAGLALVLAPSVASAGSGLETGDLGTVALGRGTAFVARADNLMAFHYNPAGLSKQRGWNVLVSVNLLNVNASFERRGSGQVVDLGGFTALDPDVDPRSGAPYERVAFQTPISPLPSVVLQYGDVGGIKGLALAGGLVPASSFGFPSYPERGPQRYALQQANLLVVYPGLALSYMPMRWFGVGAVFHSGITSADFSMMARGVVSPTGPPLLTETDAGDNRFALEVHDYFSPTATFGVMSHPLDWLEIGLSLRLPVVVEAKGHLELTPGTDAEDDELAGGTAILEESLPLTVRAGARYLHRRFDIEVDYVFERWESLEEFGLKFEDTFIDDPDIPGTDNLPVVDTSIPKNFRNAHSVRIGSDIEAWPEHLAVRVGGWYQSSAYPADHSTFNVDFPFAQQVAASAGLSWHALPQLDVTVGYAHIFQRDITVGDDPDTAVYDGGIVQMNTVREDPATPNRGNIVNNGIYRTNMNLFGISLEGHFGHGKTRDRGTGTTAKGNAS